MRRDIPIHPGDLLGGGESMRVLSHVAHQVDNLTDVVVSEEIMG